MTIFWQWQDWFRTAVRVFVVLLAASWLISTTMFWLLATMVWLLANPIVLTCLALALSCLAVLDSISVRQYMQSKMLYFSVAMFGILKQRILRQVAALRALNF